MTDTRRPTSHAKARGPYPPARLTITSRDLVPITITRSWSEPAQSSQPIRGASSLSSTSRPQATSAAPMSRTNTTNVA